MDKNLYLKNISFSYQGSNQRILQNIDTQINNGEFVCLLGQSGSGKSTLLRLLAGLEKPTVGSICLDDEEVLGPSLNRGMVFQDYGLFPWMKIGENLVIAFKQKYPDKSKVELEKLAYEMIDAVGLDKAVYNKFPKELSGGMQQRCAIAQTFGINPSILLMDEPFGALDAVTRARLQELVLELWLSEKEKKTVVFVTHDVDEAIFLANRIIVLGQSPAHIIYDVKVEKDENYKRENQFENHKILELRNELINQINMDVLSRVD
ncbi:MAG: ABC transporter ATP-binding protein [Lachnospiraceae bacterium]|jgi:NitT/TauT family transport system ATP-binding protein|nr:ABC transporter ATP-binding protein [Lachnospiraceae bacterium]